MGPIKNSFKSNLATFNGFVLPIGSKLRNVRHVGFKKTPFQGKWEKMDKRDKENVWDKRDNKRDMG